MKITVKQKHRFWAKIDKTSSPHGCWLWLGAIWGSMGYGCAYIGKNTNAHRAAWRLCRGSIPKGKLVLHNCPGGDNPLCCNPDHLWLGTYKQNMDDMIVKGRQDSILKWAEVKVIRRLLKKGYTQASMARWFDITQGSVNMIARNKRWQLAHS